jgi:hypothetical protein
LSSIINNITIANYEACLITAWQKVTSKKALHITLSLTGRDRATYNKAEAAPGGNKGDS